MKIIVNALGNRQGGSETFLIHLLPKLVQLDNSINFILIIWDDRAFIYQDMPDNVEIIRVPVRYRVSNVRRLLYENINIPLLYFKKCDLHFRADEMVPPLLYLFNIRTLAVFHATHHMLIPQHLGDSRLSTIYSRLIRYFSLKYVDIPVAVSYHEKAELSGHNPSAYKKIQVIYHGVDTLKFKPKKDASHGIILSDFPLKYVLSISNRNPHKNFYRLIQAYTELLKKADLEEHLVIVGKRISDFEENRIKNFIHRKNLSNKIHFFDFIENHELPIIYQNASAYVFPSLFETFGMTPLEAMACEIPVAVSNFGVMPEVCGDAAEYFDPLNVESITSAIERILLDETRRKELISLGLMHIQKFTWDDAARKYHRLLKTETLPRWSV